MAGESAEGTVIGEGGSTETVSRLRGAVFKWVSGAATLFGISVVTFLLLYVANDAISPLTADLEWYLVFSGTVLLPTLGLTAYFATQDRAAGKVAYESVGIVLVGLVLAGGLTIMFIEIVTPKEWLLFALALTVAAGVILAHSRFRPEAAFERLFVIVLAPLLSVFGIPSIAVDYTVATPFTGTELFTLAFSIPGVVPSVRELLNLSPVVPLGWLAVVISLTIPLAAVIGTVVAQRRDDDRGVIELTAAAAVLATAGAFAAPMADIDPANGALVVTALFLPAAFYLEGVVRRREGVAGLAFPVVLGIGLVVGVLLAEAYGFAGPNSWLDWGYLTSAQDRFEPRNAGIYPPLVGSVMIVLVIALSAFPVGVGAAIYLEEYAPNSGWIGKVVDLIEINIGNLAGVPSIVYGLLGLALFIQGIGLANGIVVVGGLTVGLLILPIVIISAQEAIRAVPDSMREASYGMGATRWQTTRNVVLPEALPGILTGSILAMGRAIGETAPLLMIGIASSVRSPPDGFFSKTGAMPRQIFSWSSEFDPAFRFGVLAAGVLVLVGVLLIMNGTAIVLRNRYQRR